MPIIITRGNNVYGPNQYPEKLIPKFIQQLLNNERVTIQGDGTNVRAFLHVLDVCSALSLVLDKGNIGEIYNIGSDDHHEYTVTQIANMLIKKIQKSSDYENWITYIEDRPFNDKRYYISNQKVKDLGWSIDMDFNNGIDKLIMEMQQQKINLTN
jgi:dTDP-D-glucose 4,6-dehydratase